MKSREFKGSAMGSGFVPWLVSILMVSHLLHANEVQLDTKVFPYRLEVDGAPLLPHIFFFNTDRNEFKYLQPQVEMASAAGVHFYSLPYRTPMRYPTDEPDFSHGDALLEKFIALDPKARFLVRLVLGPDRTWKKYHEATDANRGEYAQYGDGTISPLVSFGSEDMLEATSIQLSKIVRHLEKKYPDRILVYHVGAPSSEFFDLLHREHGPDRSPANTRAFQRYLKEYYTELEALREAWGNNNVTFDSAPVPQAAPGRYPMRDVLDRRIRAFYDPVGERPWIDYSKFYSKLMSDHLLRWCRIVKDETQGKKLTAAFYGYHFSLTSSFAGHFHLAEVLDSEYVDILCSPVDYSNRGVVGAGSFMSPVDSVIRHKKLWVNEDDTRTHVLDEALHRPNSLVGQTGNLHDTLGVIDRNIANVLAHGAGIWWMDLGASGMFNSSEIWDLIEKRQAFFNESISAHESYAADVQLIVDEESKLYMADDVSLDLNLLLTVQNALDKSTASVETYLFSDYVAGNTPRAKVVVFANTLKMSAQEIAATHERLARDKSHQVWCFLPAYIDAYDQYDVANVTKLTGFKIRLVPGKIVTTGTHGLFKGLNLLGEFARHLDLEERPVLSESDGQIIGAYESDGLPAAAMRSSDGVYTFFLGAPGVGVDFFRAIFTMSDVHLWANEPALVTGNGQYLFAYTGKEGSLQLNLPAGKTLRTTDGSELRAIDNTVEIEMDASGAQWLRIEER